MRDTLQADFQILLRHTSVPLRPDDISDIQHGWELLQPVLVRLRQKDCDFESEPATLFRPDAFDPEV
ncbi:hypothetical protein [Agrobacterium vaccinii]|uniref:hypothetical protein n=1 Tax=Agrobacterium vaccinii TaxID=2735528 RepID=UPI001E35249E|nr:hypothetical protein [Agrobacterium vaccinii]UHS59852.1 hypothetical protein HRS00_23340 [Agrobacterium vaccinii]